MRSTNAALRLIALSAVAALTAIACGSGGDTDVTVLEETTTTTVPTTTVPTTTVPTTTVPTTTTTIMLPEPAPPVAPDGMELVWSDEFDGDAVDRNNWTYDIGGWGWGNGEAQYYTDRTENSRTQNGLPFFGRLERHPNIVYGHGYCGNGVGPSFTGAKFLASLALDRDDDDDRSLPVRTVIRVDGFPVFTGPARHEVRDLMTDRHTRHP